MEQGVVLDSSLSMESQITVIAKWAFNHLRPVSKVVSHLDTQDLATVIHIMVTPKLDYCNSLYTGLPLILTWKQQLMQNAMGCVLSLRMCIYPALHKLHWLPIVYWICFQMFVVTFKALYG